MGSHRTCCPACNGSDVYRLGDGRHKCRRCGQKYTPHRRLSRLPDTLLRRVALSFWMMVPAGKVARDLQIDRKTAHRLYGRLRQAIARQGRRRGRSCWRRSLLRVAYGEWVMPGREATAGAVCYYIEDGEVRLAPVKPDGLLSDGPPAAIPHLLVGGGRPGCSEFLEAKLCGVQGPSPGTCDRAERLVLEGFSRFALRASQILEWRVRKDAHLLYWELGFRYNYRREPAVPSMLLRMLKYRP